MESYCEVEQYHSITSKVALLTYHEPRELSFYTDIRKSIYERFSLRILRGIHRHTGIQLDQGYFYLYGLAYGGLLWASIFIFFGFMKKTYRKKFYFISSFGFAFFALIIYIFSGVASLNQYDMKAPLAVQKYIDVFIAKGIEFKVYHTWDHFIDDWDKSIQKKEIPFSALAWGGIPMGIDNIDIHQWLKSVEKVPMVHLCIGAHLPSPFHNAIFGSNKPKLDWHDSSPKSICEKASAYSRHISWQYEDIDPSGLHPYFDSYVAYAPPNIELFDFSELVLKSLNSNKNACWVFPQLKHTAILRMDDPGAAQNAYLERWHHPELNTKQWEKVEQDLQKYHAVMTIGYVVAWLDDGNTKLGDLWVQGEKVSQRIPGSLYPSHQIKYFHKSLQQTFHLDKQFEFIRDSKYLIPELHGFTHITPNIELWLNSKDRYSEVKWYREFLQTETTPVQQRKPKVQEKLLNDGKIYFNKAFQKNPSVFIPPGHKISYDTRDLIAKQGMSMMSDSSITLLKNKQMFRSRLIATQAIDSKEKNITLELGYPIILLLHDRDIAIQNKNWLENNLNYWKKLGIKKYISLKELSFLLSYTPKITTDLKNKVLYLDYPKNNSEKRKVDFQLKVPKNFEITKHPNHVKVVKQQKQTYHFSFTTKPTDKQQLKFYFNRRDT